MTRAQASPVVHLELHTRDLRGATSFYSEVCGWRSERVAASGRSYLALELGALGGGVVECATARSLWLPYVEVPDVRVATERASESGGRVLLGPREGSAGWRSVIASPAGGEIAFWQPK